MKGPSLIQKVLWLGGCTLIGFSSFAVDSTSSSWTGKRTSLTKQFPAFVRLMDDVAKIQIQKGESKQGHSAAHERAMVQLAGRRVLRDYLRANPDALQEMIAFHKDLDAAQKSPKPQEALPTVATKHAEVLADLATHANTKKDDKVVQGVLQTLGIRNVSRETLVSQLQLAEAQAKLAQQGWFSLAVDKVKSAFGSATGTEAIASLSSPETEAQGEPSDRLSPNTRWPGLFKTVTSKYSKIDTTLESSSEINPK